jgi:hypothetical protein
MTTTDVGPPIQWNERFVSFLNHAIVVLMMASLTIAVVQIGKRLFPDWDGWYLIFVAAVISMEAMVARRLAKNLTVLERDWLFFRGAELIVLLVSLRIFLYGLRGINQLREDVLQYGLEIQNYFVGGEFIFLAFFAMFIWGLSTAFSRDLAGLERYVYSEDREILRFSLQDRDIARQNIVTRVFIIGGLLIFLSFLVRLDLGILWRDRPSLQGGGINILVFFMLGLVLFSITQYSTAKIVWVYDRAEISQDVGKNWLFYGLVFLLGLVVLVSLLPTGYSLGFLDLINYGLYLLSLVGQFIWFVVLYLLYLLGSLLRSSAETDVLPPPTQPPPILRPENFTSGAPEALPWLDVLRSAIFWIVFVAAVYLAFTYFFRQNRDFLREFVKLPGIHWFARLVQWLRARFMRFSIGIPQTIRDSLRRLRSTQLVAGQGKRVRFFNPRNLSPRMRVFFFYLAMVRRGDKQGARRKPSETPFEYAEDLKNSFPDVEGEVDLLTQTFVRAKYSQQEITADQAGVVRRLWGRIRSAMSSRK